MAHYEKVKREATRLLGEVERLDKEVIRQKTLRCCHPLPPPPFHPGNVFLCCPVLIDLCTRNVTSLLWFRTWSSAALSST